MPMKLREIFGCSYSRIIDTLEERRLKPERIRPNTKDICSICSLKIDHGTNYIDYFKFTECQHIFHSKCILFIYRDKNMNLEITCPALYCQHILTPYEIKELKERIDLQRIEKRNMEEENIVGICEICAKRILGKSEFIELTNCKHKLHSACTKKFPSKIILCPNRTCRDRLNEKDYYLIEEIRITANQVGFQRAFSFPKLNHIFDRQKLCLLCHKPYESRQNCILLSCFHAFHKNCFFKSKATIKAITRCPDCNKILSKTDEIIIRKLEIKYLQILEERKEPAFRNQELNICCMCKNNIVDEDKFVLRTCKHKYHQRCIRDQLNNRNQENNPICPECSSQIDVHDLHSLQLMNRRLVPISKVDKENKENQAQSICEVCKKFAYLKKLIPLGCGHRLHSECMATLIGEQTGQRYLLTPREKLDYKLVCPVQQCGHDISYINVRDYMDSEVYEYYEGLYKERMKNNIGCEMKVNKISSIYCIYYYLFLGEGEKHTLKCCEQTCDVKGLSNQIQSYLDEGFPLILGTKGIRLYDLCII